MKFYPSITKNKIPENDRSAWLHLSSLMKKEPEIGTVKDPAFDKFINQLEKVYPELPTTMIWGNYLISECFEYRISLSIDYANKDEMMTEIVKVAKANDLVVFEPKSEKIYRP